MRIYKFIISFISIVIILFFGVSVFAQGVITNWKDYSLLSSNTQKYRNVYSIAIVKLTPAQSNLSDNVPTLVKGIYYYFTSKLNYPDIPFNYIVSWNGEVFKGTSGGVGVQGIGNQTHGIVTIAYLSDGSGSISSLGQTKILNLTSSLMNNLSIPVNMVSPYNWEIGKNGIKYLPSGNSKFGSSISSLLKSSTLPKIKVTPSKVYPFVIPHNVTITSVGIPPLTPQNQNSTINISLKNSGTTPILGDMSIMSQNAGFFNILKVWQSVNIVKVINNLNIQPGTNYNFSFQVLDPKNTGNIKGGFYLANLGTKITGSSFNVSMSVTGGNSNYYTLSTGSQSVTVYSSPSLSAGSVGSMPNNTEVSVINHIPGWYEIKLANGNSGYIVSAYIVSK